MEVTTGFRRTEAGLLPDDWEVRPLGGLVKITSGASPSLFHLSGSGIPYFKVEQLGNAEVFLDATDTPYHFERGPSVPERSVVFAKRGAAIALNKVRILRSPSFMDTNLMALTPLEGLNNEYLYYALGYIGLWRFADTTSVPQINNKHVKPLPFPLPSSDEQRTIVEVLSDIDALLAGLDRLIAKKRDLKQAAMQQLLTGQTRLPGFQGEWEAKRLGDIATFHKGRGLPKSSLTPYGAEPCIHYGELFTRYPETITTILSRTDDGAGAFRSIANDVLMPTSDVTPRGLAKASCVQLDGVILGGDILVIRCNSRIVFGPFLSYTIRHQEDQILQFVTGTTVFHLYGRDMAKLALSMPPVDEQVAVVMALTDMDAELTALEARRDKTRMLKQGMMQELLTGKTRLLRPEPGCSPTC